MPISTSLAPRAPVRLKLFAKRNAQDIVLLGDRSYCASQHVRDIACLLVILDILSWSVDKATVFTEAALVLNHKISSRNYRIHGRWACRRCHTPCATSSFKPYLVVNAKVEIVSSSLLCILTWWMVELASSSSVANFIQEVPANIFLIRRRFSVGRRSRRSIIAVFVLILSGRHCS